METAVLVNANGLKPITVSMPPPKAVWGLVSMVKNYEMLTAEAAVTGDRDTAVLALTHHPLICDYDLASELFGKMLEANRAYLPQFK
jgi:6-phospho-beta-glucosidase